MLTVVMFTVMVASQSPHLCAAALARSAQSFTQYFHALRAESVNPVESLVLSLVLANKPQPVECKAAKGRA